MGADVYGVEMSDAEIAAFLARRGHGLLSFGGEVPYGLPMSFGYDPESHRCIFQLVFNPESKKRDYIQANDRVSLTAYEWRSPDDWCSVLISGRLVPIDPDTPAAVVAAGVFAPYATTVSLTVFESPIDELETQWYELDIEEMTGRQSPLRRTE